jgi:hypothetical protein
MGHCSNSRMKSGWQVSSRSGAIHTSRLLLSNNCAGYVNYLVKIKPAQLPVNGHFHVSINNSLNAGSFRRFDLHELPSPTRRAHNHVLYP